MADDSTPKGVYIPLDELEDHILDTHTDFTDYYELFGVENTVDKSIIKNRYRQMMKSFHPDVGKYDNTEDIFDLLAEGEDVLCDNEQRLIYERLGHEEYVKRRDSDDDIILKDEAKKVLNDKLNTKSSEIKESAGSTQTKSKTQKSTEVDESVSTGYDFLADLQLTESRERVVSSLYKNAFFTRLASIFAVLFLFWYSPQTLETVGGLPILDGFATYGPASEQIFGAAGIVALTVIATGLWARIRIPQKQHPFDEEDNATESEEGTSQKKKAQIQDGTVKRKKSRTDPGMDETKMTDNTRSSWDVKTRFNMSDDDSDDDTLSSSSDATRKNMSITYGLWLLMLSVLATFIGVIYADGNPVQFTLSLYESGDGFNATPWLTAGSGEVTEVLILLNIGVGIAIIIGAVFGGLLLAHGLSKEAWYDKYTSGYYGDPIAWDTALYWFLSILYGGLYVFNSELENVEWASGMGPNTTEYLVLSTGGNGVTYTMSMMILFLIVWIVYKIRSGKRTEKLLHLSGTYTKRIYKVLKEQR